MLPFTGEIAYRCCTGCRKYLRGPVKSPYEISPAKVYLTNFPPPPEAGGMKLLLGEETPVADEKMPDAAEGGKKGMGKKGA